MKRLPIILITVFSLFCSSLYAQDKMIIRHSGATILEQQISNINDITFRVDTSVIECTSQIYEIPFTMIDSITFEYNNVTPPEDSVIYIIYNGSSVEITNPFEGLGVVISASSANVYVTSTINLKDILYVIQGSTTSGSLTISSLKRFTLNLDGVSITNPSGAAINVTYDTTVSVELSGTSSLVDGSGSQKAAFHSEGQMIFCGSGTLNVTGNTKHAINSDDYIIFNSGTVNVLDAVSDGIHADYIIVNLGTINIGSQGDGIDCGTGFFEMNGGTIYITSTAEDVKGIKCDSIMTINSGSVTITVSGDQSKGLKSGQDMSINGGTVDITTSGGTVLNASGNGYDPSYCTAIKCEGNITITDGDITIEGTSACKGGKGISADGSISISGGTLEITEAGNGATYTNSSGQTDSYTAACIKADGTISVLAGDITCSSSGTGGKGINCDGVMTIGNANASNDPLTLGVTTTGERFLVSGGGWGGGDYANPKAIKSLGNININSGTITVTCQQNNEGGEGIESKNILTINGGDINVFSSYDDCINAASSIVINGGTTYCKSNNNDGIDSNGTLTINGGLTISCGARVPEEGFDCDNNTFKITGGIIVGTGGATSTPTSSVCSQRSVIYNNCTAGNAICIKNSSNEAILTFQTSTFTGSGGGGPGGGGNSMTVLFTSPSLVQGQYTLYYGGSISGGTEYHGYYNNATYNGGSNTSFNASGMVTTVGGGW